MASIVMSYNHREYDTYPLNSNCTQDEFNMHYADVFGDGEPDPTEYKTHQGNVVICVYRDGGDRICATRRYDDCTVHNFDDGGIYLNKDGVFEYLSGDVNKRVRGWDNLPIMIKGSRENMSDGVIKLSRAIFSEDVDYWITIMKS